FDDVPEVQMKIRNTIGEALANVRDHAGALAQYQKVVPYYQKTLGPDHPETLMAELHVATLHRALGNKDFGLPLLEQNLEKHKAALGPEHVQTIFSMNRLAAAYGATGQKEKALPLFEKILQLRKRQLGPTHLMTFVAMNNVAWMYQEHHRFDKAVTL